MSRKSAPRAKQQPSSLPPESDIAAIRRIFAGFAPDDPISGRASKIIAELEAKRPLPDRIQDAKSRLAELESLHQRKQRNAEQRQAQADKLLRAAQEAKQKADAERAALAALEKEFAASSPFKAAAPAPSGPSLLSSVQERDIIAQATYELCQRGIAPGHSDFSSQLQSAIEEHTRRHHAATAAAAAATAQATSPFPTGGHPFAPAAMDCASGSEADDDTSDVDPAATPSLDTLRLIAHKWPSGIDPAMVLQIATDPELRQALSASTRGSRKSAKRPCHANRDREYQPTDDDFDG